MHQHCRNPKVRASTKGGAMAVQQLSLLPAAAREVRLHGGVPLLVELMASLDARVQVL